MPESIGPSVASPHERVRHSLAALRGTGRRLDALLRPVCGARDRNCMGKFTSACGSVGPEREAANRGRGEGPDGDP